MDLLEVVVGCEFELVATMIWVMPTVVERDGIVNWVICD